MRPNSIRLVAGLFLIGFLTSSAGQTNYQRLRSFGFAEALGASPRTAPIEASDGRLYGTTFLGRASVEDDGGGIFRVNKDGTGYRLLHQFNADQEDVRNLPAPILEGTDGVLYGVTAFGGSNDLGTVFKLNKDGSGFAVLHNFTGTNGDGETPQGAITEAHDGALYGTTLRGGEGGGGVVFRINRNGTDYRVLNAFSLAGTNGYSPKGRVVDGSDGALYGTSAFGGSQGAGTVFRLSFDGSALAILHSFLGTDGRFPLEIVEASDGSLYGVAADGGSRDEGTIFKVAKDGSNFKVLHNFGDTPNDAASLYAGVVEGSDGALYGASYEGGSTFMGTIFRITKDGADYRILRSFSEEDGDCPYAGLAKGSGGTLYGATPEGGDREDGTLFRINNDGSDYTVVHNFAFVRGDGSRPRGDLVEATDGALYGTTVLGGSHEWGTVFKMNKDASGYAVLVNFSGFGDGQNPQGRLLEASDGQLYGTTAGGGSNGGGIVFKVKKDGTDFSKLYEFTGYAVWNRFPGLVEGSDGALYGTAGFDGANYPQGTVYRLAKDGSQYSVIHRFTGANGDGAAPQASLLRATDGSLYGTTSSGGSNNNGTVFKLNEDGNAYSVLHRFRADGIDDGRGPAAGLIQASDGALYGTTTLGGSDDAGTIFKLNGDGGGYALVYLFRIAANGPLQPSGSLVESSDGSLYGVTIAGGMYNAGTVFKLNKDGSGFGVVRNFSDRIADGTTPIAALTRARDGALYGTASKGGDFSSGIVFKLFSGLPQITITHVEVGTAGAMLQLSGGAAGQSCEIEARPTLDVGAQWQVLGSSTGDIDGHFEFLDPDASHYPGRFYRSASH